MSHPDDELDLCGLEACDLGGFCQARSGCPHGEAGYLVDFILARIDEDEAEVEGCTALRHEKIRKECAAKRGVIQALAPLIVGRSNEVGLDWLRVMASPYGDHPDFRPEWVVTS